MCTNFTPATPRDLIALGLAERPEALPAPGWAAEAWPGTPVPFALAGEGGAPRWRLGRFGLVPRWARDGQQARELARGTLNARSETVAEKPSFRAPWREARFALVPMRDWFEPCWEEAERHGGRSVRWRIAAADGAPLAVAGLHESWTDRASGEVVHSVSLLTLNADGHELLGRMHRPGDEKRTLAVLPRSDWLAWLGATPATAPDFLRRPPPGALVGEPAPLRPLAPPQDQGALF